MRSGGKETHIGCQEGRGFNNSATTVGRNPTMFLPSNSAYVSCVAPPLAYALFPAICFSLLLTDYWCRWSLEASCRKKGASSSSRSTMPKTSTGTLGVFYAIVRQELSTVFCDLVMYLVLVRALRVGLPRWFFRCAASTILHPAPTAAAAVVVKLLT